MYVMFALEHHLLDLPSLDVFIFNKDGGAGQVLFKMEVERFMSNRTSK